MSRNTASAATPIRRAWGMATGSLGALDIGLWFQETRRGQAGTVACHGELPVIRRLSGGTVGAYSGKNASNDKRDVTSDRKLNCYKRRSRFRRNVKRLQGTRENDTFARAFRQRRRPNRSRENRRALLPCAYEMGLRSGKHVLLDYTIRTQLYTT